MISSSIAITPAAAWPLIISRARFGPVNTPTGCPGSSSWMTSVMRIRVLSSRPLVRLITGIQGLMCSLACSSTLLKCWDGTPITSTSQRATASSIEEVATSLEFRRAPGKYLLLLLRC